MVVVALPAVVCVEDPGCDLLKRFDLASYHEQPCIFTSPGTPRVIASLSRWTSSALVPVLFKFEPSFEFDNPRMLREFAELRPWDIGFVWVTKLIFTSI